MPRSPLTLTPGWLPVRWATLALLAAGTATAHAQAPASRYATQPPAYVAAGSRYVMPTQAYAAPARYYATPTYRPAPAAASATVLNGFSRQGGIGTTPFLGNIRGAGSYQVNYDAPRSTRRRGWGR